MCYKSVTFGGQTGRVTPFTYYFASDHAGASDGQVFLDDGEALHSVELGSYTLLQLSSALVDGGLSGNVSSLVLKGGYDPQVDPLISHPLGLEEVVIMGLDAHALQGRSISAICNGQPFPSFSIYFDPFTSTMRFLFGAKAHQKHDKSFAAAEPLPLPSVISLMSLFIPSFCYSCFPTQPSTFPPSFTFLIMLRSYYR